MLNATLGMTARVAMELAPTQAMATTTAVDSLSLSITETLKAVVEASNKNPTLIASGGSGSRAATTKHLYSEYEIATLQGYCGMQESQGIPKIWLMFQTMQHVEEVRANIKEGRAGFAQAHHFEINGGVHFEKKPWTTSLTSSLTQEAAQIFSSRQAWGCPF